MGSGGVGGGGGVSGSLFRLCYGCWGQKVSFLMAGYEFTVDCNACGESIVLLGLEC